MSWSLPKREKRSNFCHPDVVDGPAVRIHRGDSKAPIQDEAVHELRESRSLVDGRAQVSFQRLMLSLPVITFRFVGAALPSNIEAATDAQLSRPARSTLQWFKLLVSILYLFFFVRSMTCLDLRPLTRPCSPPNCSVFRTSGGF